METLTQRPPVIREIDRNALVIRLERNQKDLLQLKSQLNSYRCEPKTHMLFEYIENLKNGMERLRISNLEIIGGLRQQRKAISDLIERAKLQLLKFNQLKEGVADYLARCMNH
ncbi:hypothetical protein LCGC14_2422230 [marine sediment metagenome]|uniref:Uncharacterized protein n=2 Tax=root TaxID=1 RepID=A0A831VTM9_9FLAO|nr:hypothetical protein [Pricia antarctica]